MQPDPENLADATPLPAEEPGISPVLVRSCAAFYRELPELLKAGHCRKWVAYHGDERIGFARTQWELHQKCLARGLPEGEFIVLFADNAALADNEEIDFPVDF